MKELCHFSLKLMLVVFFVVTASKSNVELTFYGGSNRGLIGVWNPNGTSWQMDSSLCKINHRVRTFENCQSKSVVTFSEYRFHINRLSTDENKPSNSHLYK